MSHEGEVLVHRTLGIHPDPPLTYPSLTPQMAAFFEQVPFLPLGYVDPEGKLWVSILTGDSEKEQFVHAVSDNLIGVEPRNLSPEDPLIETLKGDHPVPMASVGVMVSNRRRNKLYCSSVGAKVDANDGTVRFLVNATGVLGNCPKYITTKKTWPVQCTPVLSDSFTRLDSKCRQLISRADQFYMASIHDKDMDVNHRGGRPGFVRVSEDGSQLIYPEYSGNRLYQTLGNLSVDSRVGIAVPLFESGQVVSLTGRVTLLYGKDAKAVMPRANIVVKVDIEKVNLFEDCLGIRASVLEQSPYPPPVYYLASESEHRDDKDIKTSAFGDSVEKITAKISEIVLDVPGSVTWTPGQYVVLDFRREMDMGYKHMDDTEPQSLNDDFVRTFTIASKDELKLVTRTVGSITQFMRMMPGFQVDITAVGGDFIIPKADTVYVAGGIGITPLLAQAPTPNVHLLWSIKESDLPLVKRYASSIKPKSATLFITDKKDPHNPADPIDPFTIHYRRISKQDLQGYDCEWMCCAPEGLQTLVADWVNQLYQKPVKYESFSY
uniref:ARAD1A09548p n=1 Tax=Blastobotrys adeninivorans TaxID=409370 RepID=A0A060SX02_BLAAD